MNKPINPEAPVKSSSSIEVSAPIKRVWKILTEINSWPDWQKSVSYAKLSGELKEGAKFNWKAAGLSFHSEIHTNRPELMFGWTGSTIGTYAIHNWLFEGGEKRTIVWVEESLEGILPKLFRKYFQKSLDKGIQLNLQELKTAAEKSD